MAWRRLGRTIASRRQASRSTVPFALGSHEPTAASIAHSSARTSVRHGSLDDGTQRYRAVEPFNARRSRTYTGSCHRATPSCQRLEHLGGPAQVCAQGVVAHQGDERREQFVIPQVGAAQL